MTNSKSNFEATGRYTQRTISQKGAPPGSGSIHSIFCRQFCQSNMQRTADCRKNITFREYRDGQVGSILGGIGSVKNIYKAAIFSLPRRNSEKYIPSWGWGRGGRREGGARPLSLFSSRQFKPKSRFQSACFILTPLFRASPTPTTRVHVLWSRNRWEEQRAGGSRVSLARRGGLNVHRRSSSGRSRNRRFEFLQTRRWEGLRMLRHRYSF